MIKTEKRTTGNPNDWSMILIITLINKDSIHIEDIINTV